MDSNEPKLGQYLIQETIGTGSFAKVKCAKHETTGEIVAVKILAREKMRLMDIAGKVKREINTLSLLTHSNIAKLIQVISTPTDLFLIMEYVSGGELFDFIVSKGRLSSNESRKFFQQLISAVDYCHRRGVVHRDLKPENVLLDKFCNIKIIDFGLSNALSDGQLLQTSCGSPNYASPELVSGALYAGPEVDIWACGVMLYSFLTGRLPFDDPDTRLLFKKIRAGIFYMPPYIEISVSRLIHHMLTVNPMKRATVKDILSNEWFKTDLPAYLFPPYDDCILDRSLIDSELVTQVAKLYGINDDEVLARVTDPDSDPRDTVTMAYKVLLTKRESELLTMISRNNSNESGYRSSGNSMAAQLESLDLNSIPTSSKPTRCRNPGLKEGEKFCSPDCDLCPKLGATECLFGKKLPSLTTCDSCEKYAKPGCIFSIKPSIEDMDVSVNRRHPEHIDQATDMEIKPNLEFQQVSPVKVHLKRHMHRGKWHLGIRSQSKPHDVMGEIFRSLRHINMEWNCVTPFHIIARKQQTAKVKNPTVVDIQLYRADAKNFLMAFKNLLIKENDSFDEKFDDSYKNNNDEKIEESQSTSELESLSSSETLLFLDMCASIIKVLTRA